MTQYDFTSFIGFDVSKAKLDFAQGSQAKPETIDNNSTSIKKLIASLTDAQRKTTLVVVEATGGYERLLVESLQDAAVAVAVVNPRRVREFAKGIGIDAKTDPIDSKVIARYGEVVALKPVQPKTKAQKELAALVTRRHGATDIDTDSIESRCSLKWTHSNNESHSQRFIPVGFPSLLVTSLGPSVG